MKQVNKLQTSIGTSLSTMAVPAMVLMIFMLFPMALEAATTYYSRVATGNFATLATWATDRAGLTPNTTPLVAGDIFIIETGNNITLAANQTAASVTVESGGTMTCGGTFTLTSPLTIDSGGTLTITTTRLTMAGNTINNGTISLTTGRFIRTTSTLTNSGSITMGAGQFTATTGGFTNETTGTLTVTGALATLTLGTGDFVNNNTSASVDFGSTAVTVSGNANQSIGGFTTTNRFTASKTAGTTALTGDINSNGITKSGAGILDMGSATHTTTGTVILTAGTMNGESSTINVNITSTTAWQGTATVFVPGNSTVNLGGVAQTLSATGTKTFYNLTLSNSGVKTIASTTVNNVLSLEGTATASAAPTYGTTATLSYNTATARNAGAEWLATFAATGGVIIDNTGAINPNGNKIFNLDVPLTINTGATLSPAAGNTFSFGGDLINDGTWTASTGAVTITLARVGQSIGRFSTSGLVTMSKTSQTATFTGNINGGAFTMNGAGILNLGVGLTHTFTGAWTNTAGTLQGNTSTLNIGGTGSGTGVTFTAGTSTVNFNGAGAQDIPALNYYNLNLTGGARVLANTGIIGIAAVFTPGGGGFTVIGSTVEFNGGAQTIPAFTYNDVVLSGSGAKTILTATTISVNEININDGPTLDLPGTAVLNITKP